MTIWVHRGNEWSTGPSEFCALLIPIGNRAQGNSRIGEFCSSCSSLLVIYYRGQVAILNPLFSWGPNVSSCILLWIYLDSPWFKTTPTTPSTVPFQSANFYRAPRIVLGIGDSVMSKNRCVSCSQGPHSLMQWSAKIFCNEPGCILDMVGHMVTCDYFCHESGRW